MSFTFNMRLLDGSPADPPQFVSAVRNWNGWPMPGRSQEGRVGGLSPRIGSQ
jgi:hypothetical protein